MTESFHDTAANRAALIAFLETSFQGAKGMHGRWAERMAHWWDANPFSVLDARRGWIMREPAEDRLVGFLGLIPARYAIDGESSSALLPTTWVVDPQYQKESFGLARRLNRLGSETLVVSTTGRTTFQEVMRRRGWVHQECADRRFLPFGPLGRAWLPEFQPLTRGRRIIDSVEEVAEPLRPYRKGVGIEKWITTEYLRWYLQTPGGQQRFLGVVDERGQMSSYIILAPQRIWGLVQTWSVVDWFTTESGNHEIMAILTTLLARPSRAGLGSPWFLRLTEMSDDPIWAGVRGLLSTPVQLNHLHLAPVHLRDRPKSWVLAEGDLGL